MYTSSCKRGISSPRMTMTTASAVCDASLHVYGPWMSSGPTAVMWQSFAVARLMTKRGSDVLHGLPVVICFPFNCHVRDAPPVYEEHPRVTFFPNSTTTLLGFFVSDEHEPTCTKHRHYYKSACRYYSAVFFQ